MPYTGTLPITKLSEADISRCSLWWDGFNVDSSDYNFQELSLISDWMHAVMLAEGWPFRSVLGRVTCLSDSSGWAPFLLLRYKLGDIEMSYISRLLAVIKHHFDGGASVYAEFLRVAQLWHEDGRPADLEAKHYARAEDAHSARNMDERTGGVYMWISPEWDSVISVGGTPYRYCPSISSQKAFDMGRRQISLGETHNFRQRRGRYLAAQGWTNVYQGAARLLDGGKVDTITAFADHIVVVVPNVRGVQPLDRKIVETLLILGFGLRRTTKKPWGLQKNCIDVKSYHHFVNDEIANTIRWKIWEDLVENGPKTAAGFCQVKPAWSSQYWKDLLIWISQEVEIVAQADGSDTRQSSGPTSTASQAKPTYCIEAVQRILGNRSWKEDLQDYPPFPIEFWSNAGLAGVPKELMGLYETSSDLVDGAENGKDEDSQLERTSRKRSNELASLNPRNAKRKASKAAAKAAKLTQISDEENIPVEAATTATSSTTIQAPRQKRPGPPKGATSKLSFKF